MSRSAVLHKIAPVLLALCVLGIWALLSFLGRLPAAIFPAPREVWDALRDEATSGRMFKDALASLWRVAAGFSLATLVGVPLGLWLGSVPLVRAALLPGVNFGRALSPVSWIPFAIFWFGVGDTPVIFLIFMATLPPLALAVAAAVANVPRAWFRVAREHGLSGGLALWTVTLPAILPQLVTALRVGAGLAWLVVVAAEMIAGQDGLGYLVWDARNGLRTDLLVAAMIVIGTIGITLDALLSRLSWLPSVRWGHER